MPMRKRACEWPCLAVCTDLTCSCHARLACSFWLCMRTGTPPTSRAPLQRPTQATLHQCTREGRCSHRQCPTPAIHRHCLDLPGHASKVDAPSRWEGQPLPAHLARHTEHPAVRREQVKLPLPLSITAAIATIPSVHAGTTIMWWQELPKRLKGTGQQCAAGRRLCHKQHKCSAETMHGKEPDRLTSTQGWTRLGRQQVHLYMAPLQLMALRTAC